MKNKSKNDLKDKFILLKKVGNYKKGHIFESFGGLVSGVELEIDGNLIKIRFDDTEYFKLK